MSRFWFFGIASQSQYPRGIIEGTLHILHFTSMCRNALDLYQIMEQHDVRNGCFRLQPFQDTQQTK